MSTKTTIKNLRKTRRLVRWHWTQGAFQSNGKYCLVGALGKVMYNEPHAYGRQPKDMCEAFEALNKVVKPYDDANCTYDSLVDFNDRSGTTKADVIFVINQAIDKLKHGE